MDEYVPYKKKYFYVFLCYTITTQLVGVLLHCMFTLRLPWKKDSFSRADPQNYNLTSNASQKFSTLNTVCQSKFSDAVKFYS